MCGRLYLQNRTQPKQTAPTTQKQLTNTKKRLSQPTQRAQVNASKRYGIKISYKHTLEVAVH